jgi:molecular chaperone GrpE
MDDEKRVSSETAEDPAKPAAEGAAEHQAASPDGPSDDAVALAAENQALRGQVDELNDRNLRLVAEMENLRRRTERDKSEFAKYAISEFARDVLTVGDNLRRAIEAVPKEAIASDPAMSVLIEGIEVTERELLKVLERFQVKRFDPLGEQFNPHLHEAMTKVDVPNVPADTVIQTIHAGYMIGDRVLRPAAVIVAKGGGVAEQTRGGGSEGEEPIPPGAMRVPNDAVSSSSARQAERERRAEEARYQHRDDQSWSTDERVAQFRRARQAAGNGTSSSSFDNLRQPKEGRSPSTLHKPVIGGGKSEW